MRERHGRRRELRGKRRKEQKMSFSFLKHAGLLMVADFMDNLLLNCFLFFIFFFPKWRECRCLQVIKEAFGKG